MNDCNHLNIKQGQEGALICEDCSHTIFNPETNKLPEVPKPQKEKVSSGYFDKKKDTNKMEEAFEKALQESYNQNQRIENLLKIIAENTTKKKTKRSTNE